MGPGRMGPRDSISNEQIRRRVRGLWRVRATDLPFQQPLPLRAKPSTNCFYRFLYVFIGFYSYLYIFKYYENNNFNFSIKLYFFAEKNLKKFTKLRPETPQTILKNQKKNSKKILFLIFFKILVFCL